VRRSVYCTASFSVCSRRRTELPIIYPDLWLDYKVATLPFRGPGQIVAFRTYSQSGSLYLEQMGTSKGGFMDWFYEKAAYQAWSQQAENLKASIYGGERADFPGVCQ
jgi:hypothetical protein